MSSSKQRNSFQPTRRDDEPAHNSRKQSTSDDFFTDSLLESSKIPTPSPSKKHRKSAFTSNPRRAIGNTRTLMAAWDATAKPTRPSASWSDSYNFGVNSTPAPSQGRRSSPIDPTPSHTTPSPSRERQASYSLASPSSEASSPPGGLNDVYQRIADEERIAAQEYEGREEDYTDSTMAYDDYVDDDRARLNRNRTSQSPLNFRSSKRATPQSQSADANKENQGDETGVTNVSGMSFLENMTDQALAVKLTPHTQERARDRARLEKAIQKTTPLAFSKAKVGSKHALTSDNLQRSGKRDESRSIHSSSNGSTRDDDTTPPPPNVPRTWGSKGRVEKDWLRKIHDRDGSSAHGSPQGDKHDSSQVDWTAAAAEVPLPSVEDSLTPRPENSRNATPVSLPKQTSHDRIRQWELNDFTGNNLQVSNSPPVKVRNNLPGIFKDREIETLEKRAVTTNRLGELRKMNSQDFSSSKSRSLAMEGRKEANDQVSPEKHEDALEVREQGEPIPETPIVVYKASTSGLKKDENNKARPLHDRKDSREHLQRLARAISESPRLSSTPEDWSLIKEEEVESARGEQIMREKMQHRSRQSSKELADAESPLPGKRSKSADAARTPIVTGAWTDTILPDTIKTVKQRNAPSKHAQTPHVTGGWIDTPVADGKRQSSALAPIPTEELSRKLPANPGEMEAQDARKGNAMTKPITRPAPNLPRSALTSLLTKAKRKLAASDPQHSPITEEDEEATGNNNNDTLNLGDATIESLEDLLTLENADMTTLLRMGVEFEARQKPSEEKESGTETELLERLGTKLERLRTNIHDARKGISKLEHQVSQPPPSQHTGNNSLTLKSPGSNGTPCQTCGCPGRGSLPSFPFLSSAPSRFYITIPLPHQLIPRLYHPPRKDRNQWLPRPTLLGWLTLLLWTWYLAESILCGWYCHPEYAEVWVWPDRASDVGMDGMEWGRYGESCADYRFGWVVWRLLGRRLFGGRGTTTWLGALVRGLRVVLRTGVKWMAMLMGWTDGFVDEAVGGPMQGGGGRGPDVGAATAAGGAAGFGEDATMLHDEYL